MKYLHKNLIVVILIINLISLTACSILDITQKDPCNNHTNINMNLKKYVTTRYTKKKFIRLGIFPFSVPANLTSSSQDRPDFGMVLAQKLQPQILSSGVFTTAEVLNYSEWSGKKQEFFSNNLLAIEIGRNIGLDFIVVGYLAPQNHIEKMTVYTKIIDVNTGITLFYGETTATNTNTPSEKRFWQNYSKEYSPNNFKLDEFTNVLMICHGNMVAKHIK